VWVIDWCLSLSWTPSYSYKSSQYGLAIDNVVAYEIVLPNGTIKTVTSEDEDLFFGLKVGG
jgi:FAD/FMN-containing dehydrogenase